MAASVARSQPSTPDDVVRFIDSLCHQFPSGFSAEAVKTGRSQPHLTAYPRESFLAYLKHLMETGRVIVRDSLFVPVTATRTDSREQSTLSDDEKAVLQVITDAGDSGVALQRIKDTTRLAAHTQKLVTSLIRRGLIKQVRSVKDRGVKLYMLASLAPADAVTGGLWYNDQREFDSERVNAATRAVLSVLPTAPPGLTVDEIAAHLATLPPLAGGLRLAPIHVASIIELLLADSLAIERVDPERRPSYYRVLQRPTSETALSAVPCGSCVFSNECHPDGPVNPRDCLYLAKWLQW